MALTPEQRGARTAADVASLSRPSRSPFARRGQDEKPVREKRVHPLDIFEPMTLSRAEREAILEHLEEPASVALLDTRGIPGVNPVEIKKWIGRFSELEEMKTHRGIAWAGFEAVRDSIQRCNAWEDRCLEIQADGGPRHPSQFGWNSEGDIFQGAIGADARDMVRSEILDDGTRKTFTVHLRAGRIPGQKTTMMPWVKHLTAQPQNAELDDLVIDDTRGTVTCSICQYTQAYEPKKGRRELAMVKGRMARHLKTSKDEINRHRSLYQRKFR
jgi:hypothetical protein